MGAKNVKNRKTRKNKGDAKVANEVPKLPFFTSCIVRAKILVGYAQSKAFSNLLSVIMASVHTHAHT